ncbi:MAG: hypothetical protein ABI934_04960 [Actinomycetota bacterium]
MRSLPVTAASGAADGTTLHGLHGRAPENVAGPERSHWSQFQMFTRIPFPQTGGAGTFVTTAHLKPLAPVHEKVTVVGTSFGAATPFAPTLA